MKIKQGRKILAGCVKPAAYSDSFLDFDQMILGIGNTRPGVEVWPGIKDEPQDIWTVQDGKVKMFLWHFSHRNFCFYLAYFRSVVTP
jgi:hypothetical protein